MGKFLKEPLVHFVVLGALLFAAFAFVNDEPEEAASDEIVISVADAQWLVQQFTATWNRPPSTEETAGLIDGYLVEELYVREALSLGLDYKDAVIRRRLRQKM
ncbi:MAG: hypothetical protein ACU0BB_12915 [Paracoccaceae bacterium]